jgi:hypothetical protein
MSWSQCVSRAAAGSRVGSPRHAANSSTAASTATSRKFDCQPSVTCSCPPITVASGGQNPIVMPTQAITRVRSGPRNRSWTMARPTTMPAALPAPCSTRAAISDGRSGASAASSEPIPATASPTIRMRLRPWRSDSGPYSSCSAP